MVQFLRSLGLRHRDWLLLHEEERNAGALGRFLPALDVLFAGGAVVALRHDHVER
jgi:hypothetical protein